MRLKVPHAAALVAVVIVVDLRWLDQKRFLSLEFFWMFPREKWGLLQIGQDEDEWPSTNLVIFLLLDSTQARLNEIQFTNDKRQIL